MSKGHFIAFVPATGEQLGTMHAGLFECCCCLAAEHLASIFLHAYGGVTDTSLHTLTNQPCQPKPCTSHADSQGLMPLYLNPKSGRFTTTRLSLGALGDSYYEYLLKMWVMKGRSQEAEMYRIMWEKAMDEMIEKLVFTSSPEGLTYVAEFERYAASWCALRIQQLTTAHQASCV